MEKRSRSSRCLRYGQSAFLSLAILGIVLEGFVYSARLVLINANGLGRQCRKNVDSENVGSWDWEFSFGIVSCSDERSTVPHRSFQGMMDLVSPNKLKYAERHGYEFVDASDVLDVERPPSWSKIHAVRKHLSSFDWVFWNDADSLVTNFDVTLDDLLKSIVGEVTRLEEMPDLIVTEDVTGVNAGMFLMRDSSWSRGFLNLWWNQTSFIKPFGESKSGDNDALKYLLKNMNPQEKKLHVRTPKMQCSFNSYLWIPSWKNAYRLLTLTQTVWQGAYSYGDFMVHLAGVDNKKHWIQKFLQEDWVNL